MGSHLAEEDFEDDFASSQASTPTSISQPSDTDLPLHGTENNELKADLDSSPKTSSHLNASSSAAADNMDCREVVLFSRILRMIDASSNSLRQQIVNDESECSDSCAFPFCMYARYSCQTNMYLEITTPLGTQMN